MACCILCPIFANIFRFYPTDCWTYVLKPRVLIIPVASTWTHALNQDKFLVQSSLQKASGRGVRTHPPMVLSAMHIERLSRSGNWPFTRYSQLTFFLVWRFLYIVSEVRPPSLMRGGLFGVSWWLQGGGRAIVTLWAAVRDLGKWHVIIPVLSLCRRWIVGGDLPPTLSFRSAGGG